MAKKPKTPFEIVSAVRLRPVPLNAAKRFAAMPVTDYEIILAQHFEIMSLRARLGDG